MILNIGGEQLSEEEKSAISLQKIAKIAVVLANDFIKFLIKSGIY